MVTPESVDGRHNNKLTEAMEKAKWVPGQTGGGGAAGARQENRWRSAISAVVTEQDCQDVILAMRDAAKGGVRVVMNRKGDTVTVTAPPDVAAARLFFEVLRVVGPGAPPPPPDLSNYSEEELGVLQKLLDRMGN